MKKNDLTFNELLEVAESPASKGISIEVPVAEYTRLKDIETRFEILKEQMIHADYCPIHQQIILGITQEYEKKQKLNMDMFPQK